MPRLYVSEIVVKVDGSLHFLDKLLNEAKRSSVNKNLQIFLQHLKRGIFDLLVSESVDDLLKSQN